MANPTAAMLVIGDEILSGRTRDANMFHLSGKLTEAGIDLKEVRVVADEPDDIITAVNSLRAKYDNVFTSGGIGPTHDDITADCIAKAFGVGIDVREDAKIALAANYENGMADLTDARLRMTRIPDGATLIDNKVSKAPGFTLENVHVMAGVPKVFECMIEWLLPQLAKGSPMISATIRADQPESKLADPLGEVAKQFPELSLGSYPFYEDGNYGSNLVVRGIDPKQVALAEAAIREKIT